MEYQNHESRHVFLAISVVLLLTCPLFLPVVPQTVTNIMHHKSEIWHVFTPNESYMAFAIGFFLLFLSSLTLFFLDIKKMSIFISVLPVLISIGCFIMAALPYKTLGDEGISFKEFRSTDEYTYSWEEVKK